MLSPGRQKKKFSGSFIILFALSILFLFHPFSLKSQPYLLKFDSYTKDNGLLHSYILCITQDREGFIWVGSYGGLNRFDGNSFSSYRPGEYQGLKSSIIHSILEPADEKENILWLGTEAGLIKYSKETDSFTPVEEIPTSILTIIEDDNKTLWLGTRDKGLLHYNPESGDLEELDVFSDGTRTAFVDQINSLLIEPSGVIWIGTQVSGLIRFEQSSGKRMVFNTGAGNEHRITHNTVSTIMKYGRTLFIGTWGGGINLIDLNDFSSSQPLLENDSPTLLHTVITDIITDNKGNIWCSSHGGGLFYLSPVNSNLDNKLKFRIKNYRSAPNTANGLCSNMLKILYKDKTGNIWIGSTGGSLSKIDFYKQKFRHYLLVDRQGNIIEDNNISAICEDSDGSVWYGTRNSGIYLYSQKNQSYSLLLPYPANLNDPRNSIRVIYRDPHDRMWVGTDLGFFLYTSPGKAPLYYGPDKSRKNGLPGNEIISLCIDKNDDLWVSINGTGISRLPASEVKRLNPSNADYISYPSVGTNNCGLVSNQVWTIYNDSGNTLWLATSRGLQSFDYNSGRFIEELTEHYSFVHEVRNYKGQFMWFGSFGNGAYLLNRQNRQVLVVSSANGLPNNNVNAIQEDLNGNIWFSTGKGLVKLETTGLYVNNFDEVKESLSSRLRVYSMSDGLQKHEFNHNSSALLKNGKLAFGGPGGFNIFDPQDLPDNTFVFPVKLTDFQLYNKSIKGEPDFAGFVPEYAKSIQLNYKQNYFTIDFSEICFTSPEKVKYSYMLEGLDQDWIQTDARHNSATYTGLKEGKYIFKIKGANGDGHWGDTVTRLNITITPPFWHRMIFRIPLYSLLLALLVLGFYFQSKVLTTKKQKELDYQKNTYEKDKLRYDLKFKTQELASTTVHLARRNEKLNEIREKLVDARTIARTEVSARLKTIISEIEEELKNQDNWESFELNFNLIHNDFIKRLAEAYPALSQTDIKICAYMRMNLSSKEIAGLLNITPASLETSRIRIRKKMNLDSAVYLSNFILRF